MSESPFSSVWYRCAGLEPKLRSHTRIHRHEYRDDIWYVLEDPSSGRFHRFTPTAHYVIASMNGQRTVDEIWRGALEELGDDAPSQTEMIQLLGQLHNADVLQANVPPDVEELFTRHKRHRRARWTQRIANPLSIRIPLVDPERFLVRALPAVRPLFGWIGASLWMTVVAFGIATLATQWDALTQDVVDRALSVQNLLVLWLVYPAVKLVHELGHAFATKVWGGEVHEIGIMLLVLFPVPYVDASSASAFRSKRRRMVVGAAGILVELFLAALALLVWVNVEPGVVSSVAYNVMLIGGVSTLFFNGNPLLRFDGYYVLADGLEMPNLAMRSRRYIAYLAQRHLLGVEHLKSPATARGERGWLLLYGVASFVYRMFIMFVIALFVAGQYFVIGVALAILVLVMQVLVPLGKMLAYLIASPRLGRNRARAGVVASGLAGIAFLLLLALPAPLRTRAEGVVWVPDHAQVRAAADGMVVGLLAAEGSLVTRGQPLLEVQDSFLGSRVRILEARLRELAAYLTEEEFADRSHADVIRQEMISAEADLARARERAAALTIRSPADGIFLLPGASDLPGRFVRRGDLLGYVRDESVTTVRVVVGQDAIGLVRERNRGVEVVLADGRVAPITATIQRAVPAATHRLPTQALGTLGGGSFATDPRDPSGLQTLERVFQLDVTLPRYVEAAQLGARAHVRFDHGSEPPGLQIYRALRQLLLSRFSV